MFTRSALEVHTRCFKRPRCTVRAGKERGGDDLRVQRRQPLAAGELPDPLVLADRIDELLVSKIIDDASDAAFIAARDVFLATADAEGRRPAVNKGGDPGFVRFDRRDLVFPNYDGNGMYLSAGNMLVNPAVGLLFLDLERGHRMRVDGVASIDLDDPLTSDYPEAQFVVRVRARAGLPELPPVHPSVPAGLPVALCPAGRCRHAGAGVEALGLGGGRAARGGPGARPRARGPRRLTARRQGRGARCRTGAETLRHGQGGPRS